MGGQGLHRRVIMWGRGFSPERTSATTKGPERVNFPVITWPARDLESLALTLPSKAAWYRTDLRSPPKMVYEPRVGGFKKC